MDTVSRGPEQKKNRTFLILVLFWVMYLALISPLVLGKLDYLSSGKLFQFEETITAGRGGTASSAEEALQYAIQEQQNSMLFSQKYGFCDSFLERTRPLNSCKYDCKNFTISKSDPSNSYYMVDYECQHTVVFDEYRYTLLWATVLPILMTLLFLLLKKRGDPHLVPKIIAFILFFLFLAILVGFYLGAYKLYIGF